MIPKLEKKSLPGSIRSSIPTTIIDVDGSKMEFDAIIQRGERNMLELMLAVISITSPLSVAVNVVL